MSSIPRRDASSGPKRQVSLASSRLAKLIASFIKLARKGPDFPPRICSNIYYIGLAEPRSINQPGIRRGLEHALQRLLRHEQASSIEARLVRHRETFSKIDDLIYFGRGVAAPVNLDELEHQHLIISLAGGSRYKSRNAHRRAQSAMTETDNRIVRKFLKRMAHVQLVGISQVIKAATRIPERTRVEGEVGVQLLLENDARQQEVGSKQLRHGTTRAA